MVRGDKTISGKIAHLIGAGFFAAVCGAPVAAQAQAQSNLVFGQKAPQQGLLNRMFGGASDPEPASQTGASSSGQGTGQGAGHSAAAQQAAAEEGTNGDSPFPKQYLLNKMFSRESLGLEPEAPAPAPTPAAKTP
jgi:hypothetical protein